MTKRTDIHSPANFDPADYQVVDYIDNKRPEPPEVLFPGWQEIYDRALQAWQQQIFKHFPDWRTGGDDHQSIFQCNHCGQPHIRYVAVVEHIPTGKRLAFGEICAERTELSGRDAYKKKFASDLAAEAQRRYERELLTEALRKDHPELVDWLQSLNDDYNSRVPEFFLSLKRQLRDKGTLSEAQIAAGEKARLKEIEWQQRRLDEKKALETAPALEEGRYVIEGTIVSTKWQENDFGGNLKCLVKFDNGNKVWGTVPAEISNYTICRREERVEKLEGLRVRFAAKVERKQGDQHFGFYSRPTKPEILNLAEAQASYRRSDQEAYIAEIEKTIEQGATGEALDFLQRQLEDAQQKLSLIR